MATFQIGFVTESCCYRGCDVTFAFTRDYYDRVHSTGDWWYCPNGHRQHYSGPSDAQKLRDAKAREVALNDQLRAATRDAEESRVALLRDRARFANGVCPCCNRSFSNVRNHMAAKHPEYNIATVNRDKVPFKCSCGRTFDTYRGLRIHQGTQRDDDWDKPGQSPYWAHLTRT